MSDEHEYVLGQDVTTAARSKTKSGSVMVSVRLSADELATIEAAAQASGRSLSQVIREAIRNGIRLAPRTASVQSEVTVSVSGGATFSTGGRRTEVSGSYPMELRDIVAV